jgi:heptose I phosphotransferase
MASDHVQHGDLLIHRDFAQPLAAAGLDTFDALFAAPGETNLKKKGLATWRERIVLRVGGRLLFLKRYTKPPLSEQLRQRLTGFAATAEVEWYWIIRLAELGIGAPTAVAYGRRRSGPIETHSLLLTAAVPGMSMEKWTPLHASTRLRDRAFKHRLIEATADLVNRLHGAGLFHRDLYLAHLFLDDVDDQPPALSLIDLQRVIHPRLFIERWRVKDLASLNYSTPPSAATRADRVRWYKRYRGVKTLMAADRRLIRAVAAKTGRIARHSRKRGLG